MIIRPAPKLAKNANQCSAPKNSGLVNNLRIILMEEEPRIISNNGLLHVNASVSIIMMLMKRWSWWRTNIIDNKGAELSCSWWQEMWCKIYTWLVWFRSSWSGFFQENGAHTKIMLLFLTWGSVDQLRRRLFLFWFLAPIFRLLWPRMAVNFFDAIGNSMAVTFRVNFRAGQELISRSWTTLRNIRI